MPGWQGAYDRISFCTVLANMNASLQRLGPGHLSLSVAAAIWLPCVHFCFSHNQDSAESEHGISGQARKMAARHLQLWTDPVLKNHELQRMRGSNAEWDFMGRSFLVWSLAEMAV